MIRLEIFQGIVQLFFRTCPVTSGRFAGKKAIFPERLNGKYWLFFGDRLIWYASSENGTSWVPEYEPLLKPRRGFFDSVHVEMGPPPLRTKQGWLILYHGIDESITYRLGYLLLDLHNPLKILKRSKTPIFEPRKNYELGGQIDITQNKEYLPQVIFCNGAILEKNCLSGPWLFGALCFVL